MAHKIKILLVRVPGDDVKAHRPTPLLVDSAIFVFSGPNTRSLL